MARSALFVSTSTYADDQLAQLPSAARDAVELGGLFADPRIGPFTVSSLESPSAQEMRLALEDLFSEATADDTVVLYLSGHGLKDLKGNLYFAAHDTRPNRLQSTAVPAQLLCSLLNDSRAEGVVVFLDCCYGGAFARGMVARAAGDPQVGDAFAALGGGSRSRAVITASSAIEYAFEGERLTDSHVEPSVFASAMRDGIAGGEADRDGDGWVGLSELFEYIRTRIQRAGQPQTPQLWTFGASGDLQVTRSPRGPRASVSALPAEIRDLLSSPVSAARLGAATDLGDRAAGEDLPMARAAVTALAQLSQDDSLRVREAAAAALTACTPRLEPESLRLEPGGSLTARLTGPAVALDAVVETVPDGITATLTGDRLVVRATEHAVGTGDVRLRWAGGSVSLPLVIGEPLAIAEPPATKPEPAATAPAVAEDEPAKAPPVSRPVTAFTINVPRASDVDRPVWLIATAVLWLVTLFLPAYAQVPVSVITVVERPLHTAAPVTIIVALVMAAVGLVRYRWPRDRITLALAFVLMLAVQYMAVLTIGEIANVQMGIGTAAPFLALTIGVSLVYLIQALKALGDRYSPGIDRPAWLIAAGVVWLTALFLPIEFSSGFDSIAFLEAYDESTVGAVLLLVAGPATIGVGVAGLWPTEAGARIRLATGIGFGLLMVALSITLIAVTATYDGFGQAGMLALEPLTFALIYLAGPALALIRRLRK